MISYYRTTKRFYQRPSEGKAMYVNAFGTSVVNHKPLEIGETLIVPTARYESNPRPVLGKDDPDGLEGRCRQFCLAEFKATEGQVLEALRDAYLEAHGEGGVLVLVQGPRNFGPLDEEEGLRATYEFGVAVLSWVPEELAEVGLSTFVALAETPTEATGVSAPS